MQKTRLGKVICGASLALFIFLGLQQTSWAFSTCACQIPIVNELSYINSNVTRFDNNVSHIANNANKEFSKLLYEPNPFATGTKAANNVQIETVQPAATKNATESAEQYLESLLTVKNESDLINKYADLCGSDYTANCKGSYNIFSRRSNNKPVKNASFSATSLLNNINYTPAEQKSAKNFISFASATTIPFSVYESSLSKKKKTPSNSPVAQQFRVQFRNYLAQLSVGLNQLFYIYGQHSVAQKVNTKGNGQRINLTTRGLPREINGRPTKYLSPDKLDQLMATRRISGQSGAKWFKAVSKASPAKLQRMTVELLAEMRYEMFKQRMIEERMLATLATMELEFTQESQLSLGKAKSTLDSSPANAVIQKEEAKAIQQIQNKGNSNKNSN